MRQMNYFGRKCTKDIDHQNNQYDACTEYQVDYVGM